MNFLAAAVGRGSMLTILILCICVCIFTFADVCLVISLHRQNKRLAEKKQEQNPAEDASEDIKE